MHQNKTNLFRHKVRHIQGFTLLSLAIVLMVIGLIVGGVVTGRSLIRAGELRAIMNDANAYTNALATFRQKYKAYPGDMVNATSYWTAAGDSCTATLTVPRSDTCNGNGNGQIASNSSEMLLAWQHLSNAQILDSAYSGAPGSDTINPGLNIPLARFAGSKLYGFFVYYATLTSDAVGGHVLLMGRHYTLNPTDTTGMLSTEDAANIDTKMDDGLPGYGSIRGMDASLSSGGNCATTSSASTARYATTQTGSGACALLFKTGI